MKATTILFALASCSIASAAPSLSNLSLQPRQDARLAEVQKVIDEARANSANIIKEKDNGRRRLQECSALCQQCSAGATTKALGEIATCGVAALALDVATAGATAILEAALFIGCETTVIGALQESEANCLGLN